MSPYGIVVKQPHVLTLRRYKGHFRKIPSVGELQKLGVDFNLKRGDTIHVHPLTEAFFEALSEFEWIRP